MSAESGLKTFRDADGLWEGHKIQDVATPEAWKKNPQLVLDFYNQRRRQLKDVSPNVAHHALAQLESTFHVVIITQNVDNLHERAGSKNIIHLHGELTKVRSVIDANMVYDWTEDVQASDVCTHGHTLRPHIVWFGEEVPLIEKAIQECINGDIFIIIGTSMQVYPAASLIRFAPNGRNIYYIDPNPHISPELSQLENLTIMQEKASIGVLKLVEELMR